MRRIRRASGVEQQRRKRVRVGDQQVRCPLTAQGDGGGQAHRGAALAWAYSAASFSGDKCSGGRGLRVGAAHQLPQCQQIDASGGEFGARRFRLEGPLQRWEQIRAEIRDEILERAYDPQRHTFTQSYGSAAPGAGALMVGPVGPLEPTDDRFTGTIDAVRRELGHDGFIALLD